MVACILCQCLLIWLGWMDACEGEKEPRHISAADTPGRTLVQADKKDAAATPRNRTREVNSRFKPPTPAVAAMPSVPGRSQSPKVSRAFNLSPQLGPKRSLSAERKRPSTPPSPVRPSTPAQDALAEVQSSSIKVTGRKLPESLWPSTMRSLSVSFQSDTISIPVSKKEKPAIHALSDRALKSSSNVSHRQGETPAVARKPTPERKRSPLKGKNSADQSENYRPDGLQSSRLIDQHRWLGRASAKVCSSLFRRSLDLSGKGGKISNDPFYSSGKSSLRRLSAESVPRSLRNYPSDAESLSLMDEIGRMELDMKSADDTFIGISELRRLSTCSLNLSEKTALACPAVKIRSLPGSNLPSPSRTSTSRAVASPSRTGPYTPTTPSRGTSPSPMRSASPTRKPSTTSVLSFVADIRKGKKGSNQLEDAHRLRLFYNRYLQWRFANARSDDALFLQKVTVEQTLYTVWRATVSLWDSLITKRINLQQLQLELKLNLVLKEQLACLEDWASLEKGHSASLVGVVKDLEASTLRVPVTGGAKTDTESLKAAICSAIDVMQTLGSSMSSVLSKVEGVVCSVQELAEQAARGRSMLDESESLLASLAAMQVQEYSLRTQLIELQQDLVMSKDRPIRMVLN